MHPIGKVRTMSTTTTLTTSTTTTSTTSTTITSTTSTTTVTTSTTTTTCTTATTTTPCTTTTTMVPSSIAILVATGYDGNYLDNIEVIGGVNTESITSCSNLPSKFPLKLRSPVVIQHNFKVTICGGLSNDVTGDCYSYSNNQWNIEAFKLEPARYGAFSTEIRPGEWLVMGGRDDEFNYLTDTQILQNGFFSPGPDLPEPMHSGSSTLLNDTHVLVVGGENQTNPDMNSPRNYILDINNHQWTQVADRNLELYHYHSSGTFYNSTAGELQVANIGKYGIEVYSPKDNSWHQITFPSPLTRLYRSATVQLGMDSFLLIGGKTNLESNSGDVYLLNENGLSILKENVLQVPRRNHVAMLVSDTEFTCN